VPELAAGYRAPPPGDRPSGLRSRRVAVGTEIWRVEATAPSDWSWSGFPVPRYRFDPASGRFRTRYGGATVVGAVRERYRATGLVIPADHAAHFLVRLAVIRPLRVLDLRTERNLDSLAVDDQISTGQHPRVWATCHRLADSARMWWTDLDAIVYRSRTTPTMSANYAFFSAEAFQPTWWRLAERTDVLTDLVLRHGFTVGWDF
jgi:hypothetical protein